jgi:hypothetical protein
MDKRVETKRGFLSLALGAVAVLVMAVGAFPQATQVTLEGTIADEQGNALPGAAIAIKNTETGYLYSALSRDNGAYTASGIQPGTYEVEVKLAGFATQKNTGMVFNVGARLTINFTLKPSALQEELTVTAATPLIEVSKSEVSSVVDRQKIDDIPLLDRNFASLVVLKAGVQEDSRSNALSRGNEEILIDGVSNEWVGNNITRAAIPADAIEEFRVLTNQFQAEYGNSSGMIMSAISRSGTNTLRGRLSFFYRDQAFDSVNYFVNHEGYKGRELSKDEYEKTQFDHYNFSGFVGGPIVKDKAHFFLAYEGLKQNSYSTITSPLVPRETIKQPAMNHQFIAKFNYQINEKNLLTFRYTLNRNKSENQGVGGLYTKEVAFTRKDTIDDFQANWTFYPSDNTINELRILHSRTDFDLFVPDLNVYYIQRPSGYFGKLGNQPQKTLEKRTQIVDNFSVFLGNHTLKFGFDYANVPLTGYIYQYNPGYFIFTTDAPFDPNNFATYPLMFLYNSGDVNLDSPYSETAVFAQDTWKVIPRLTLNLGFRYNYYTCEGLHVKNGDIRNLNPRFGFSYDLTGDGKTALRGGFGTFSANPMLNSGLLAYFMNKIAIKTMIFPNYPDPFQPNPFFPTIPGSLSVGEYGAKENAIAPYSVQTTLGVERALLSDLSVAADLIWTKGYRQSRYENMNPVIPGTSYVRPDMTRGDVWLITDGGTSDYKGLYLTVNKRYSHGWALEASYTLSKSESDVESEQTMPHSYDPDAWDTQWGPTDRDARHRLSVTGIVDLPLGFQLSGYFYYRSKLPWNAIYSDDVNADSVVEDYVDAHRNSRRGFGEYTLNARISKFINISRLRLQLFGEFYNLTNRANFYEIFQYYGLPDFGKPTEAGAPRLIQLGVRIDF